MGLSVIVPAYNEARRLRIHLPRLQEYLAQLGEACELIVVDDGYDLFLTMVLYPNFGWDEEAYHLEGDPEGRLFSEILVDVVAAEVIEPWGGGKWHLEIFRAANPEPEDWNGEM